MLSSIGIILGSKNSYLPIILVCTFFEGKTTKLQANGTPVVDSDLGHGSVVVCWLALLRLT